MRKEIENRVKRAIEGKVFPGCVIGTIRTNGSREILPFGHFTYDADAPAVREDTIYDLASITKSIPTASLTSMLVEEGKLQLTDAVVKYLPELQNDFGATIENLLTYRVCGAQMSTLKDRTSDEILLYVFEHGFEGPPRDPQYTNLPALLLGLVVERIGRAPLDVLAQEYFFGPLGMKDTTFFTMSGFTKSRHCAPTEIADGEEIQGIVHDESARVFATSGKAVGHAGLFSTAPDILNFLDALLHRKYQNVVEGAQKGLGWQLDQSWFMGSNRGRLAFGKTGFTGTSVVVDIERGIAFVILSNRTYPKRPHDAASIHSAINKFRADIADILLH